MNYQIIIGDAREKLAEIEPVDAVITSPPYWGIKEYPIADTIWGGNGDECEHEFITRIETRKRVEHKNDKNWRVAASTKGRTNTGLSFQCPHCGAWKGQLGTEPDAHMYIVNLAEVLSAVHDKLKPDGYMFVNIGDTYHNKNLQGIPYRLGLALQTRGWYWRDNITWNKTNPYPDTAADRMPKHTESVLGFSKQTRYRYFIHQNTQGKLPKSIWNMATAHHKSSIGEHIAPMPRALVEECLLLCTEAGDTVLDPFAGTGTVAEVALRFNRSAVMIDMDPRLKDFTKERLGYQAAHIGL